VSTQEYKHHLFIHLRSSVVKIICDAIVQFRVGKRSLSPYWHIRTCVTNNNQHDFSLSQNYLTYARYTYKILPCLEANKLKF